MANNAKRALYQLIISQLNDDGFSAVAQSLSDVTMIPPSSSIPQNRLDQVFFQHLDNSIFFQENLTIL